MNDDMALILEPLNRGEIRSIELTIEPDEHDRAQAERYKELMAAHQQLVVMGMAAGYRVAQYYRADGTWVTEIWKGARPQRKLDAPRYQ